MKHPYMTEKEYKRRKKLCREEYEYEQKWGWWI
jgi:hypothetical protein